MEDNKVNELLTIDKIRGIIEWLYENINYLQTEPFIKDRVNDILNGKRVEPYKIGYGVFIEDTNGKEFDAVKFLYDLRSTYFERCIPLLRFTIKKVNAKELKETHQYVKTNVIDIKEKGLTHKYVNLDFQLFMNKKIVEFFELECMSANGLFYQNYEEEIEELKKIANIQTEFITNFIKNFCTENKVGSRIGNIFYAIANTHLELGFWIVYCAKSKILDNTQYEGIVKESRTLYEKEYGIRPRINGFYLYLLNNVNKVDNLFDTDYLEKHLADYVMNKKSKTLSYADEAQEKQQALIDITPHQTLSIETTAAAVEEIKELSTDGILQNIEKDYCEVFFLNDWLSYRVFYQVQFGVQMCNDSANFTKLIGSGGMNIDTLNKIQKEQSIVYDKMVNQELELLKALFRVKYVRESIEPLEYLKMRIENVENELKVTNKETYYDIISTRKERGIKYGARLISPINYYYHNNINVGIIKFYPDSYEGLTKESDVDSNSVYGNDWTFIESKYYFLKWLKRLSIGEFYFEISEENRIIEVTKTTSATVEEGKKDEIIDFVKDINPCIEFDNLFRNDIKGKIEIWNYMIDLKMIDSNGAFSMGSRRSFIRSFVLIMKKYFKIPNQSDTKLTEIFRLKLLGNSGRINNSVKEDEQQIEDFLNGN